MISYEAFTCLTSGPQHPPRDVRLRVIGPPLERKTPVAYARVDGNPVVHGSRGRITRIETAAGATFPFRSTRKRGRRASVVQEAMDCPPGQQSKPLGVHPPYEMDRFFPFDSALGERRDTRQGGRTSSLNRYWVRYVC